MDEEVGTPVIAGAGVARKIEVEICAGAVTAGFPPSGVEAESVANRSVVGFGVDIPTLQARRESKSPISHGRGGVLLNVGNRNRYSTIFAEGGFCTAPAMGRIKP